MDDEGEKIRNGIDDGGANSGKWVGGRIEEFVFFSHFPGGHDWFRTKATTMNGNIYATHTDLLSTQFLLHYA